jgi:hypothetical protein
MATTTPVLGLFKPVIGADDDAWGSFWNSNADTLDAAIGAGGPFLPLTGGVITAPDGATALKVNASNTQTTADHPVNEFWSTVNYTADAPGGDNLALTSYMAMRPNGRQVMLSGHTSAIYGDAYLDNDGNAASHCSWLNGGMFVTGNAGPGTLDRGVDVLSHPDYNTGGGTYTNHYFLYHEPSHAATNEYAAYFSAPVGIGTEAPTFNIDMNMGGGANVDFNNALRINFSANGSFFVTRTGASFYPGFNPGPGGLGVLDLVVGFNGSQNATNASSGFLYISSCPGTPTVNPTQSAIGRIAVTYDTVAHKLWVNDGTTWRGVVLT